MNKKLFVKLTHNIILFKNSIPGVYIKQGEHLWKCVLVPTFPGHSYCFKSKPVKSRKKIIWLCSFCVHQFLIYCHTKALIVEVIGDTCMQPAISSFYDGITVTVEYNITK